MLYLDVGVHAVSYDRNNKSRVETGNGGQLVVGFKYKGEIVLEPVGGLYPEVLTDQDSPMPGCGVVIKSAPQRVATNKFGAQVANNIINTLLAEQRILAHQITFDSRMNGATPYHVSTSQQTLFDSLCNTTTTFTTETLVTTQNQSHASLDEEDFEDVEDDYVSRDDEWEEDEDEEEEVA